MTTCDTHHHAPARLLAAALLLGLAASLPASAGEEQARVTVTNKSSSIAAGSMVPRVRLAPRPETERTGSTDASPGSR